MDVVSGCYLQTGGFEVDGKVFVRPTPGIGIPVNGRFRYLVGNDLWFKAVGFVELMAGLVVGAVFQRIVGCLACGDDGYDGAGFLKRRCGGEHVCRVNDIGAVAAGRYGLVGEGVVLGGKRCDVGRLGGGLRRKADRAAFSGAIGINAHRLDIATGWYIVVHRKRIPAVGFTHGVGLSYIQFVVGTVRQNTHLGTTVGVNEEIGCLAGQLDAGGSCGKVRNTQQNAVIFAGRCLNGVVGSELFDDKVDFACGLVKFELENPFIPDGCVGRNAYHKVVLYGQNMIAFLAFNQIIGRCFARCLDNLSCRIGHGGGGGSGVLKYIR